MMKNINKAITFYLFIGILIYLCSPIFVFATQPASTNFQLQEYGFGAGGNFATGLLPNTTYYLRVKARQGNFAESAYGPSANATTNTASLTFTISSPTINFGNLNSSNSVPYTDNAQSTIVTTSTNAFNGYSVYGHDTQALTFGSNTISNYGSPNSTPTT